ncbi:DUF6265 family protein [uncultured Psychrosphaera sp.]|uniref:DUF6265 family protein n=1 Tax=uncultured Psychrosphaera sp. TaxID=1403522 RepID=UPI0030FC6F7D
MIKSLCSLILILSFNLLANKPFPNVLQLAPNQSSPAANLNAVKWMAGHWRGEAFGGITEEVWSAPLGGSMMGAFKLVVDNQISFYEIETISELNGSLIFQLKHFAKDLKGWEEKDDTIDFPLVKVTPNKVYFNGLTLERVNNDEINIYVVIEDDGVKTEQKFNYKKVK